MRRGPCSGVGLAGCWRGEPQGVAHTLAVEGVSFSFQSLSFASFSAQTQLSVGCLLHCRERQGQAHGDSAHRLPMPGLDQAVLQLRDCPAQPSLSTGCSVNTCLAQQCSGVQGSLSWDQKTLLQSWVGAVMTAITRLPLTIQLVLANWHCCRTEVLPLEVCHK